MSKDKWYLQTIACNIDLSSCRLIAESLARALNSKLWSARGYNNGENTSQARICSSYLTFDPNQKRIMSTDCMPNVVNQPSRSQLDSFEGNLDQQMVVSHGWINKMAADYNDEIFNTPPCSSPPSPTDDTEEIIVNPPVLNIDPFPFHTRYQHNFRPDDVFTDGSKLREKLQKYADGLLSSCADNTADTFYDADNDLAEYHKTHNQCGQQLPECQNEVSELTRNDEESESHHQLDESDLEKCSSFISEQLSEDDHNVPKLSSDVIDGLDMSSCILIDVQPATPTAKTTENCNHFSFPNDVKFKDIRPKLDNRHLQKVIELEEEERPKLLRTTSLKIGKTPPGTPGRKKIVRFADVLGLDLEAVRHIICDDLPHVPSSAFNDLKLPPEDTPFATTLIHSQQQSLDIRSNTWNSGQSLSGSPVTGLLPLFEVPGSSPDFLDRVKTDWVSVEKVTVSDLSVHCVCCVLSIHFEKTVTARYTINDWQTYNEVVASYVPHASEGEFDRFTFSLFLQPSQKRFNQRLCFAIRYQTNGLERWDNNRGQNYILRFHDADDGATSVFLPPLESDGSPWLHHFY